MTIAELHIQLDLNADDKADVLDEYASECPEGHFFVDSESGKCYLFDEHGDLDDVNKIKTISEDCINKDINKIVIPDNVTSIGGYAFSYCRGLTSVTIPNGVTNIGRFAFGRCSSLKELMIPDSVETIWGSTKIENNSYTLDSAFNGCNELERVIIGNGVKEISDFTFFRLKSLKDITLGNSITSIGVEAFSDCSGLTSITIPDKVTNIGGYAFIDCIRLKSITIPDSVMSIGDSVFHGCSNLKSLIFKDKTIDQVKSMRNYPFGITDELIIRCED